MATPWTTSVKDIDLSNNSRHYNSNVPVSGGFTPPSPVSSIACGPQALFAAMAKAQALRTANAAIVAALERGAAALVETIVDDAGNRFDLAPETDMLENTVRRALSGSVGAGICHLCMVALGYVWQDFAAEVINTTGKLADFAYDGGPASGHGIVLAEAKGSFSDKVDATHAQKAADSAYKKQVDGHIGAWTKSRSAQVVHGYAIAFGAQPDVVRRTASPPHAMFHLAETAAQQPAAAAAPRAGGSGLANAALALGNYRAAFILARAPLVVDVIDWLRTGRSPERSSEYQVFSHHRSRRARILGWRACGAPERLGLPGYVCCQRGHVCGRSNGRSPVARRIVGDGPAAASAEQHDRLRSSPAAGASGAAASTRRRR
jgi:hypothetical protein